MLVCFYLRYISDHVSIITSLLYISGAKKVALNFLLLTLYIAHKKALRIRKTSSV